MIEDYEFSTMSRADVATAIEWAAAEGWNPGLDDVACFYAADMGGFLMGRLRGQPVATISVVQYGATFGFLGLYIVKPGFRGHGYGYALWQAGLARLAGRVIGLDGVVAQQDNYRKSGFSLAYRNVRYQGTGGAARTLDARIVPLASLPLAETLAYDRGCFGFERAAFIRPWLAQADGVALGAVENGALAGYGVVRPSRSGWKIGPLFADSAEIADALFDALAANVPVDAPLFLDVPEPNIAAVALAERRAMTVSFETARMYRGTAPDLPLARIFGVTSFELG